MANVDSPFGLSPVRYLGGGCYNGATNTYVALASYATDLFIGDPVVITGSWSEGYATIERATAGATNRVTGVVTGFEPNPDIVSKGYGAASTLRFVQVADDPQILFEGQADGAVAADDIGLNANLTAGTGNTMFKRSGFEVDVTGAGAMAADATFQVTIRGVGGQSDNEFPGVANPKLLVTLNLHTNLVGAGV